MFSLTKNLRTIAAAIGMVAAGFATTAQAQTTQCGVIGSATAAPAVYDPFNPSGLATTSVTLTLTRVNGSGGGDTRVVNFYLKANPSTGTAADGSSIIPRSVSGSASIEGIGLNIFHNYNGPFPTLTPITLSPSGGNRFMKIDFTGNNAGSNSAQVTFDVALPPNLNLSAIQNLAFDVFFHCNVQGGQNNGAVYTSSFSNAVVFPVTVLSALRTYYAGTALAFGDISTVPPIPSAPVRTSPGNYIFVQSSGAYEVSLSSQNAFKMRRPSATGPNEEIRYSLKFLGDVRDNTTTPTPGAVAINHSCIRAGLASAGQQLPIQATLQEGGQGKNPGIDYQDILTVTITPLAYAVTGTDNCGGYTVP